MRLPNRYHQFSRLMAASSLAITSTVVAGSPLAHAAPAPPTTRVVPANAVAAPAPTPPKVDLVLDLSGSMNENDAGGQTRLYAAVQAVTRIIDTAPEQAQLGLRVYGSAYAGLDVKPGCADTRQLVPVETLDAAARAAAKQRVAESAAVGFTPIGVSLRAAAQDLGSEGPRRIILVSDGEDTCAPPPPCEVAKELKAEGVDLAIDTVGFKTTGVARDQLKCIADATGGSYADADNADTLSTNLNTLFRGAWTTYQATGTPVQGSTHGCTDAPLISPGQYLDALAGGRDLYYRVGKRPDQQLQVSATAVAEDGYSRNSGIEVSAGPSADKPDAWLDQAESSVGWANVITTGARSTTQQDTSPVPDNIGCVKVANNATEADDQPMPVELLIGIGDATTAKAGQQPATPRTGADAAGGFSFNSATPIAPGTYHQSIAVGEAPFWRVDVNAGQQLSVKAGVDIPTDFPGDTATGWTVAVYNAMRNPTTCNADDPSLTKLFSGTTGHFERACGPWLITRTDADHTPDPHGYTTPGTYYIQAQVAEPSDKAKGVIVPISLTVDVTGAPAPGTDPVFFFGPLPAGDGAEPVAADSSGPAPGTGNPGNPDTSAPFAGNGSASGSLALPLGIGAGVVLIAAATLAAWSRRHRGPGLSDH